MRKTKEQGKTADILHKMVFLGAVLPPTVVERRGQEGPLHRPAPMLCFGQMHLASVLLTWADTNEVTICKGTIAPTLYPL